MISTDCGAKPKVLDDSRLRWEGIACEETTLGIRVRNLGIRIYEAVSKRV